MARLLIACVVTIPALLLLLPAFAVALLMNGFTSAVRFIARQLEPRFMRWTDLIEFDPALGWKPRPGLNGHYLALHDDVFRVETDEEGWPGRSFGASDLVVVGDSFAFGYGVDADKTFAAMSRQIRVKPVGAPGYSLVQGVQLIERFGDRLRGKLVVWFAYLENDLQDNLAPEMHGYRSPFVRRAREGWELVDRHLSPRKWHASSLDSRRLFATFCVPGPLADHAYEACDYLIGRAAASCRHHGADLVVVTIPHPMQLAGDSAPARSAGDTSRPFDPGLPDLRVSGICCRHAVPFVAGRGVLSRRHYKRREGIHWNGRGHVRMARVLEELFHTWRSGRLATLVPADGAVRAVHPAGEPLGAALTAPANAGIPR